MVLKGYPRRIFSDEVRLVDYGLGLPQFCKFQKKLEELNGQKAFHLCFDEEKL